MPEEDFPKTPYEFLKLMLKNPFSSVIGAMGLESLKLPKDAELVVVSEKEIDRAGVFRMEKQGKMDCDKNTVDTRHLAFNLARQEFQVARNNLELATKNLVNSKGKYNRSCNSVADAEAKIKQQERIKKIS
eukprot:scaffold8013_cov139-Amphora_coffeaeformis.AAC.5